MPIEETENIFKNEDFKYYAGVKFEKGIRFYFFGTNEKDLKEGDHVIVETDEKRTFLLVKLHCFIG